MEKKKITHKLINELFKNESKEFRQMMYYCPDQDWFVEKELEKIGATIEDNKIIYKEH